MAATGNEVPLLSQLKLLKNWIDAQLATTMRNWIFVESPASGNNNPASDKFHFDRTIINIEKKQFCTTIDVDIPIATATASGVMSPADKAKLDALPSSFAEPAVDIVRTTTHSTSYTKDTLEIVTDSSGKVTEMWFVTAD